VPASSGAKASLACEDRRLDRVCSRVESVAEVDERHQGSEKRETPLANGRADGSPGGAISPQGESRRSKGVDGRRRGGKTAAPGGSRAGRPKRRSRAKVFDRWKAPRIVRSDRSFTRAVQGRSWRLWRKHRDRASGDGLEGDATGVSEARSARVTTGRQRPPRRSPNGVHVLTRQSELALT